MRLVRIELTTSGLWDPRSSNWAKAAHFRFRTLPFQPEICQIHFSEFIICFVILSCLTDLTRERARLEKRLSLPSLMPRLQRIFSPFEYCILVTTQVPGIGKVAIEKLKNCSDHVVLNVLFSPYRLKTHTSSLESSSCWRRIIWRNRSIAMPCGTGWRCFFPSVLICSRSELTRTARALFAPWDVGSISSRLWNSEDGCVLPQALQWRNVWW